MRVPIGIMASSRRKVSSTYDAVILADNPVSYWRLGELSGTAAIDQKGLQNGTYFNGPGIVNGVTPDGDKARSFLLAGRNMQVPDNNAYSPATTGAISVECWIYLTSAPSATANAIVQKHGGSGLLREWHLYLSSGGLLTHNCPAGELKVSPIEAISAGAWYHVAFTWRGGLSRYLYINGVGLAGAAAGSTPTNTVAEIRAGDRIAASDFPLNGYIDELAIYNYELTPAQILAHYEAI